MTFAAAVPRVGTVCRQT